MVWNLDWSILHVLGKSMYLDKQIIVINQEKYCYRLGKLGKVLYLLGMLIFFSFCFQD
jgi:hypothetical protein